MNLTKGYGLFPPRLLIFRELKLYYLVVLVPVFAACYLSTGQNIYSWLVLGGNSILFVLSMTVQLKSGNIRRSHFLYLAFFSSLLFSTMLMVLRTESLSNVNIKGLLGCLIWSSVFVSAFFIIATKQEAKRIFALIDVMGFVITLSVYAGLILNKLGIDFGEVLEFQESGLRTFGPIGDQVGFIIILFMFRSLIKHRWFAFTFHIGGLLLTATRGAFFAFLIGIGILAIIKTPKFLSRPFRTIAFASAIIVVILSLVAFSLEDVHFLFRIFDSDLLTQDILTRLGSMTLGLLVFRDNPLTGVGFNGFMDVVGQYNPEDYFVVMFHNYVALTANQFIQTATDGGILGLILLFFLLKLIVYNIYAAFKMAPADMKRDLLSAMIWLLTIIFGNQAAVWLLPNSLICYFFFLLAGVGERLVANQSLLALANERHQSTHLSGGMWKNPDEYFTNRDRRRKTHDNETSS